MKQRHLTAILLPLTLAVASAITLAGCGQNDTDEYCSLIKENTATLETLAGNVETLTAETVTQLRSIETVAPEDVKGDWKTFNDYLQAVVDKDQDKLTSGADTIATVGARIDQSLAEDCHITMTPGS